MDDIVYFWNGWEPILRTIVVGSLTYFSIIFILRFSGKRTLANMNAFDFVITVALGSAYGRILTAKQVSVAEAITTFVLLALLQYIVAMLETRSGLFYNLFTSQPNMLFYRGRFLENEMRRQRIRKDSLLGAVRKNRLSSLDQVEAIILETDGVISVIKKNPESDRSSFEAVLQRQNPKD